MLLQQKLQTFGGVLRWLNTPNRWTQSPVTTYILQLSNRIPRPFAPVVHDVPLRPQPILMHSGSIRLINMLAVFSTFGKTVMPPHMCSREYWSWKTDIQLFSQLKERTGYKQHHATTYFQCLSYHTGLFSLYRYFKFSFHVVFENISSCYERPPVLRDHFGLAEGWSLKPGTIVKVLWQW